jgi:GntR family transcriptional regulator of arabinose operon
MSPSSLHDGVHGGPAKTVEKELVTNATQPKYRQIIDSLRQGILAGHYRKGARLPSEAELVRRFGVSRMTVVKAMQYLQQEGLLVRRTGSGSFASDGTVTLGSKKLVFGLIIPDLGETEIFEPICKGMVMTPGAAGHSLAWGSSGGSLETPANKEDEAERLCEQYIEQKVSGVFFAPVEFGERRDHVNRKVLKSLSMSEIPIVLLDRCVQRLTERREYDLVGLDNRRAGYVVTDHLVRQGAKRICFLALEGSAETVDDRMVGYREALYAHGQPVMRELVLRMDPRDAVAVGRSIEELGIDAVFCANDHTAAQLMQTLMGLGVRVPQDVRIAGIDDVKYASLLPVPLTTVRQPCREIGAAAIAAMMDRVSTPGLPARSILLDGALVVRQSCGTKSFRENG